jgi:long-chain acyl-CoA synthetase
MSPETAPWPQSAAASLLLAPEPAATESPSVGQLLDAAADSRPAHPALVCGDARVSYAELRERVDRLAHALADRGLGPGDPVALLLPDVPELAVSFLAIARLGAVVVPLNPQFKGPEIEFHLRECGARAVIAEPDGVEGCRALAARASSNGHRVQLITTGREPLGGVSSEALIERYSPLVPDPPSPDADVVFQYSSGSTGRPKRVPRTHRQLHFEADRFVAATGIAPADTIFCAIPLFHTYGMGCCLLASLRAAATLLLLEHPHPFALQRERALELLEREGASVFPGVPFMFRLLAEAPVEADLRGLRLAFSAANALPRSTFDAFARKFAVPIRQLYGCTEAGTVTVNVSDDPWSTAASVGSPLGGVEIDVLDAAGGSLEPGRIGEVVIRSPAMTRAYAGVEPQLNEQAFRDGYFVTGDRGRLDDDGALFLTGRRKLLIDVKGDKVDPIEVEDVLAVHPKVREVVVVGVRGPVEGEELIKAVVVADDGCRERELVRFCQERLANYKVPHAVEFRDEIPKSSGKVLRKYLV